MKTKIFLVIVSSLLSLTIGVGFYLKTYKEYARDISRFNREVQITSQQQLERVREIRKSEWLFPFADDNINDVMIEGCYQAKNCNNIDGIIGFLEVAKADISRLNPDDCYTMINYLLANIGCERIDAVINFTDNAIEYYASKHGDTSFNRNVSRLMDQRVMWTRTNPYNVVTAYPEAKIREYHLAAIAHHKIYAFDLISSSYFEYSRFLTSIEKRSESVILLKDGLSSLGHNRDRDASLCMELGILEFRNGSESDNIEIMGNALKYLEKAREYRSSETSTNPRLITWKVYNEARLTYYVKSKNISALSSLFDDQKKLMIEWQKNQNSLAEQYHYLADLQLTAGRIKDLLGDRNSAGNYYGLALHTSAIYNGENSITTKGIRDYILTRDKFLKYENVTPKPPIVEQDLHTDGVVY